VNDDDPDVASPPADWAEQLLTFWFDEHGEEHWFGGGAEFDAEVSRFTEWRDYLRAQPVESFLSDASTALAALILFDQVPRNCYRGDAEAFATDHIALQIARAAIERGWDSQMPVERRLFFSLPFEHSENLDDQRESVRLTGGLGNPKWLQYAVDHKDMIERFGRFPHRNKALGRADRPGEAEAVAAGAKW
jgi:uncharacterized protein (DUF924 family)